MANARWVPLRTAWTRALYGPKGFYRTQRPADHFRTSAHVSPLFAAALVRLAHRHSLSQVWDLGSGSGELLHEIHRAAPELELCGVDIRPRPVDFPCAIGWATELPVGLAGLVVANELLDDLPCDIVELADDGGYRVVEVDLFSGEQRLGEPASVDQIEWLEQWWPLQEPGDRAEVGLAREEFWASVVAATRRGLCVAIDYGHLIGDRPRWGSLTSYRRGRQLPVSLGGDHDISADVAFDALADRVGGTLCRQSAALHDLGVTGRRPDLALATEDPAGYLRALAQATEGAELTATGGLGDFYWLLTTAPLGESARGTPRPSPPPATSS